MSNQLDNIKDSTDTTMTVELVRLFKYAGCNPTVCHACQKRIKVGDIFKLLPHKRDGNSPSTDEMCCAKCGEPELNARDVRARKAAALAVANRPLHVGGYSRPSRSET